MRLRRTVLAAVSSVIAVYSTLAALTGTAAHADPEIGTALPAGPAGLTLSGLFVDGQSVYASWAGDALNKALYVTPFDGTGTWTQVTDPTNGHPVTTPTSVGGGVVVAEVHDGHCQYDFRLITPTGAWNVPESHCHQYAEVGPGGDLVWATGVNGREVYRVADGPGAEPVLSTDQRILLTGPWIWTMRGRVLTGHDTNGGHPDRRITAPAGCVGADSLEYAVGDGRGRTAAMLSCETRRGPTPVVLPLTGGSGSVRLTGAWGLGPGFLTRGESVDGGQHLVVHDLSATLTSHDYGLVATRAVSRAGSPGLVYLRGGSLYSVALDWLQAPPTSADDDAPPRVAFTGGTAEAVRDRLPMKIRARWDGRDGLDVAPLEYDVQVRHNGPDGPDAWRPLPGGHWTFDTFGLVPSVHPRDRQVCFRVRARDRAGNASAWAAPHCTWIDRDQPTVAPGSPTQRVLSSLNAGRVSFRFHGADDTGGLRFDVRRRSGVAGHLPGNWSAPPGWTNRGDSHVTTSVPAGHQVCVKASVTDRVGRRSEGSSRTMCVTAPYDDPAFAAHDGAVRLHKPGALGGAVSALSSAAFLAKDHVSGSQVWVLARTAGHGCPRLRWGPYSIMANGCTIRHAANGFRWYVVDLGYLRHAATLRIRTTASGASMLVDAVAVVR